MSQVNMKNFRDLKDVSLGYLLSQ